MHTEFDKNGKTSFVKRRLFLKRLLLNIVWLLALVVASFIYEQSLLRVQVASHFIRSFPWYIRHLIVILPLLIIQGILHWLTLKHYYPNFRRGNIIWVAIMPFLFLIGYAFMEAWLFALVVSNMR
jgi:hypothetical protein